MESTPATKTKRTPETVKMESRGLRGGLARALEDPTHAVFPKEDLGVLKFHGIYQQEDRDLRGTGPQKTFAFMVRVAIPGGALSADQYLALDDLAGRYGNGSLRLTSRQGVQFHGTLMNELRPTLRAINEALLTTFAACGDIRRNVMACPAPLPGGAREQLHETARAIARELEPRTRAYHEIWIDGEKQPSANPQPKDPETFYGPDYLPRKFKVGLATEDDNCIDAFTQDCALVAIVRRDEIVGYNLLAGGGLGITHNKADTFARLATPIGFIEAEHAVEAVRTVAAIFRDHGNRQDRRRARLKYLLEQWGAARFHREFESRVGWRLKDPRKTATPHQHDHLGSHPQAGGGHFYGLWVENGRLDRRGREGVRAIVERFRPGIRTTAMQSLLFTGLASEDIPQIEILAESHGLLTAASLPQAVRGSMACPALPSCGLALAEAERFLPSVTRRLAERLETLGLQDVPLIVRMTGCPNACARPYNADIGFVGRRPGVYHVFVGGGVRGDRMADLWHPDVEENDLITVLDPLLEAFRAHRRQDEGLSDFYRRHFGRDLTRHLLTGREAPTSPALAPVGSRS